MIHKSPGFSQRGFEEDPDSVNWVPKLREGLQVDSQFTTLDKWYSLML